MLPVAEDEMGDQPRGPIQPLRSQAIPLRAAISIPLIAQLFMVTGLVVWLAFRSSHLSIDRLISQLLDETAQHACAELQRYLQTPIQVNRINAAAIQNGSLDVTQLDHLGRYFWRQLQIFPVDHISYGAVNGDYIGAGYNRRGVAVIDEVSKSYTRGVRYSYRLDPLGHRTPPKKVITGWDHRDQLVYRQAQQSGYPTWSSVYAWNDGSNRLFISAGYPVYDAQRSLQGVLTVNMALSSLQTQLTSLAVGQSGHVFILQRDGMVIMSSSGESSYLSQAGGSTVGGVQPISAERLENPVIRATVQHMHQQGIYPRNIQSVQRFSFNLNGERQMAQIMPFQDGWGLDWLIVVVASQADFTQQVQVSTHNAIWLIGAAILTAACFGWLTSRWLTTQVQALIRATQGVSQQDWQQTLPDSKIQEFNLLIRSFNSMTLQLQNSFSTLERIAYQDALTGLLNRTAISIHLEHAIATHPVSSNRFFALLFLDLDGFKLVNDTLGHLVGDQLLVAVSDRIRTCMESAVGKGVIAARFGGDEFIILIENMTDPQFVLDVAEYLCNRFTEPFPVHKQELYVTASIGVVLSNYDIPTVSGLLSNADIAMYHAKAGGKSRYRLFDASMRTQAEDRLELELDLRRGLDRQEFHLHYQPIVDLEDCRIVGLEALLRWRHPIQGWILPGQFVEIAEEIGLITQMEHWVLQEACQKLSRWQADLACPHLYMHVNLSSQSLMDQALPTYIKALLTTHNLDPQALRIEIAERTVMKHQERMVEVLKRLVDEGISLSMDDFGTGYASLSYLYQLPISALKIDRSFINQVVEHTESLEIIRAIMALSQSLGIGVVAEGVATHEQLETLKAMGCNCAQGYLFSAAIADRNVEHLLASQTRLTV